MGFGEGAGKMVTNFWELGHRIQLTLGDCLVRADSNDTKEYQKVTSAMFRVMKTWKDDKDGLIFNETSNSLRRATLKQRGSQETRWANADLHAKKNFFRNAPTIHNCLGQRMTKFRLAGNQTKMKEIQNQMKPLMNCEFWLMLLGYTQFQNILVEASLESQHSSYFASSSVFLVLKAVSKIRELGL